MSRARHGNSEGHDKEMKAKPYNAEGSEAEHEAEELKHGGRKKRKEGGHVEGMHSKRHRMDRPGRKRGGAIGADKSPLTTAAKITDASEHKAEDGNSDDKEHD